MRGDTSVMMAGTDRSIRYAELGSLCPVAGGFHGHPSDGKNTSIRDDAPCQHHPLGIWQPHGGPGGCCCSSSGSPPRSWPPWWPRPPCCPSPNRRAKYPASRCRRRQSSQPRRPRRPPPPPLRPGADHRASPFHHCESWAASRQRPDHDHPIGSEPSAGHGRRQDTNHGALDRWRHHPAHRDRATDHGRAHHHRATSTVASTTTLVTTTSIAPTTGPTTSAAPTSTGPTTTGPATTTTGPVILSRSRPAGVSAATVGALLPILGLLYLLRGLVPQVGGTHARRRRASHPRRRG